MNLKRETIIIIQLQLINIIKQNQLIMMMKKPNKKMECPLTIRQEIFQSELEDFTKLIKLWRGSQGLKGNNSERQLLIKYAKYIEEANNYDRLKGPFITKSIKYEFYIQNIQNQKQVFLGTNFLQQKAWKINFSQPFIQKLQYFSWEYVREIFLRLYVIHEGYLNFNEDKPNCLKPYQRNSKFIQNYYTIEIKIDQHTFYLLLSVAIHRLPYYHSGKSRSSSSSKFQCFQYQMIITCQDIIQEDIFRNKIRMKNVIDSLQQKYENNLRTNYQRQMLVLQKQEMSQKYTYYHQKKKINQNKINQIYPTLYKNTYPDSLSFNKFNQSLDNLHNCRVQVSSLSKREEAMINQLQRQMQKNSKVQFEYHQKILVNLYKTPNFKYNLTAQQKRILYQQGNLIVAGRSGTGKTTCAMLRLYGIEFAKKFKEFNELRKLGKIKITKQKCLMILLNQLKMMKNIFLTFSGSLIDQIKKQYDDMHYQISQKHSKSCQLCKKTFIPNQVLSGLQEDFIDKQKRQQREQQKRVVSLNSIEDQGFPGFFTIQNFIKVIDKTINKPFFSYQKRRNKYNQADMEIKRVYINHYSKNSSKVQAKQAVYVDFNFFNNHIWKHLPKIPKLVREFPVLTSSIVWSEIISIIKGSISSYLEPGGCISQKQYISDKRSIFKQQGQMKLKYKQSVYQIFKSYQEWCRKDGNVYDFTDIINHILAQVSEKDYQGPTINYIFIDEVQDLTASTIFLISKMASNNIFYCGDTAQAITKGVSFKFDDLKDLFDQENTNSLKLKPPKDTINLTVNFRSHNFILQLANSIVSFLDRLFPNSIDKIKKQKSNLFGPKPFVLQYQNEKILSDLICGKKQIQQKQIDPKLKQLIQMNEKGQQQNNDNNNNRFKKNLMNPQQIVIVRNLQSKKLLPSFLKKGIVLFPQSAKGLQFNEVILYNFFSSCPIFEKWDKLLQHLQPSFHYQKQQDFQRQLQDRNKQQGINQPLTQESKRLLGYDPDKKSYRIWTVATKPSLKGIPLNLYYELASQLKILYTAITRARSVFVIFDQKIPRNLLKLWKNLDLITFVDIKNVQSCYQQKEEYLKQKKQNFVLNISEERLWYQTGCKMYYRKDYDNSKICFQRIGRFDLVERIQARQIQIKAQNELFRINNAIKKLPNLQRDDRKIEKLRLQQQRKEILYLYIKAAKIYQRYKRYNDASQAYFKAEQYDLSLKYSQINHIEPQQTNQNIKARDGLCLQKLKNYDQAAKTFKQSNDIEGLVNCYKEQKNWEQLSKVLITNIDQINEYPQLPQVGLNCFRQILSKTVDNRIIKKQRQDYLYYYGLDIQEQLNNKKIYQENQLYMIIQKICLEIEYQNLKTMHEKLQKRLKTITERQYLVFLSRKLAYSIKKIQNLSNEQQIQQKNTLTEQEQTQQNQRSNQYTMDFEDYDLEFDQDNYDHFLEIEEDMVSSSSFQSQLSQMTDQYQQNQINIGGINISLLQKQNLMREITEKLKDIQQLVQKQIFSKQQIYKPCHHNYMQEQLIKKLSINHNEGVQSLIICNKVEQHAVGLFICDYYKDLVYLSTRHILGCLLKGSLNFKQSRYFKQQIYQIDIARPQSQFYEEQQNQQNINLFLASLHNNGLMHKVPRMGFQDKLYYETIISSVIFGLILQGYFKKLYIFCQRRVSCRLAYLSLSSQQMKICIKEIAEQISQSKQFKDLEYYFTQDPEILTYYPEVNILNVFFYQQIVFSYDQYQFKPFLSKKKMSENIDIEDYLVKEYYQNTFQEQIKNMTREKEQFLRKISCLKEQNKGFKNAIKNKKKLEKKIIQRLEQKQKGKYKKELDILQKKNKPLRQQLAKHKSEYAIAQHQMNATTLSKKSKDQYQKQIKTLNILLINRQTDNEQLQKLKQKKFFYEQQLQRENKAYQNHQKKRLRVNQKQKEIQQNQQKMNLIHLYISQYSNQLQNISVQQTIDYYKRFIEENQTLIEQYEQQIPQELQIQDKQQLRQKVVKRLMKQQKIQRWKYQLQELRSNNMGNIKRSNIPQENHYVFLSLYMYNDLTQNIQEPSFFSKVSNVYYQILIEGITIDELQRKRSKKNIISMKICNIILFYLSYIFNKSFCQGVNKFIEKALIIYKINEEQREKYILDIKRNQNIIMVYEARLRQISEHLKTKANQDFHNFTYHLRNSKAQLEQYQNLLKNYQQFPNNPSESLQQFLNIIYERINKYQEGHSFFMEILFGFFNCRVIKQCKTLDFLSNQYVLVRHNSIIIQKMLKEDRNMFAYYFDNENQLVLCRFEDVQRAMLNLIEENHMNVCNKKYMKMKKNNLNTPKNKKQTEENQQILKITQHFNRQSTSQIRHIYEQLFLGDSLIKEIRKSKREALQYLLRFSHKKSDAFYFASHQVRQYYIIEKIMENMTLFNYQAIKEVQKKMQGLRAQLMNFKKQIVK